jgi:capsular exopolysaccharide synthesis family protein
VRAVEDVEGALDRAVLASVPTDSSLEERGVLDFSVGGSPTAEVYRKLRTNLAFVRVDSPVRRLVVTSASQSEGKTTTAINLAAALAESGNHVVLVDADLRRPAVGSRLGANQSIGFTDYLLGRASIDDLIQESGQQNLAVLTSGPLPPNPAELLGSQRAREAVDLLSERYDYVVIDTAPVLPVTDAVVTARWADGVLLVARSGTTRRRDVSDAMAQLSAARVDVLGAVLNYVPARESAYGYGYYGDPVDLGTDKSIAGAERSVSGTS